MSRLRKLFLLGSIATSLALPQLAFCAGDSSSNNGQPARQDKAKIDETKRHDRGFAFTPLNENSAGQASVATPAVKKADLNKPTKAAVAKKTTEAASKVARVQTKAPIITAVQKTKHEISKISKTNSADTTSRSRPMTAAAIAPARPSPAGNNMLVKFNDNDGGAVISARLDKGGTLPSYKVGDKMVVNVKANHDCNVVVFNYDSTGTLTQIFPNDYQQNGFIKAGDSVQIGGPDSPFDYQIAGKGGPEKIFVYAYPTGEDYKSPITAMAPSQKMAMVPVPGTPFRSTDMTIEEYRKLVNNSQEFFSRSVEVKPRTPQHSAQLVSDAAPVSPNKVELTFSVDK